MIRRSNILVLVALSLLFAGWMPCAAAASRAWLDRSEVALGDSVTLNIETDASAAAPDLSPLRADFDIRDQSSSRQVQMVNGAMSARSLFGVVLTPRHSGELTIPALRLGSDSTAPLRLSVAAAAAAPAATRRGDEVVFLETEVDDARPYVQQSVGVVLRLYFATQLASGELDLPTPSGASLQRVGDDANSVREIGGRRYNVVERRFLLVPERSGELVLPPARFDGRAVGGFFDDYFGRGSGRLSAASAPRTLQVQPQPDGAPQPWLPLRSLQLRYTATPQQARTGEAATLVVEATAQGATQAQFPELPVPSVPGAQVFAEPARAEEHFDGDTPRLKLTRRYSIVPSRPGHLVVPGMQVTWWDVASATARNARLPDLTLDVAAGAGGDPPASATPALPAADEVQDAPAAAGNGLALPAATRAPTLWIALAAVFALLWLATLAWALSRGRRGHAAAVAPAAPDAVPVRSRHGVGELRRAIDAGGLDEVARLLCEMAGVADLDALQSRLADPAQRAAVASMQRARWGGDGDIAAVRSQLREAFRQGPRFEMQAPPPADALPPLYPRR